MKKFEESFLIFYVMLYFAIIVLAAFIDLKILILSVPWIYVLYKFNNSKSTNIQVK